MESKNKNELTEKIKASILKNIKNNAGQSSSNGGYKKSNVNSEGSSLSESQNQSSEKTGSNQSMKEPEQKKFPQHSGITNEDHQESNAGPMKSRLDAGRQKMQEKTREIKNRAMGKVREQKQIKRISKTVQGRKEQMEKIRKKAEKQMKKIGKEKIKKVTKTRAKMAAKRAAANAAKKLALKAIKQAAMQAVRMIIAEIISLIVAAIAALGWWVILIIIVIVIIVIIVKHAVDLGIITLAGIIFLGFI